MLTHLVILFFPLLPLFKQVSLDLHIDTSGRTVQPRQRPFNALHTGFGAIKASVHIGRQLLKDPHDFVIIEDLVVLVEQVSHIGLAVVHIAPRICKTRLDLQQLTDSLVHWSTTGDCLAIADLATLGRVSRGREIHLIIRIQKIDWAVLGSAATHERLLRVKLRQLIVGIDIRVVLALALGVGVVSYTGRAVVVGIDWVWGRAGATPEALLVLDLQTKTFDRPNELEERLVVMGVEAGVVGGVGDLALGARKLKGYAGSAVLDLESRLSTYGPGSNQ